MNKNKFSTIVLTMLIITVAFVQLPAPTVLADQLDQYELPSDPSSNCANRWYCQSFIPTLPIITRVQIYIRREGSPSRDVTVAIRSNLDGPDLTSKTLPMSQIPTSFSWVEFDFPNYTLTTGQTYYLYAEIGYTSLDDGYTWRINHNGGYANGKPYHKPEGGSWVCDHPDRDFCFKVYGDVSEPPNNPPNKPSKPSGPDSGDTGNTYQYSTSATDPDGDKVQYRFNWGDGITSGWTSLVNSGTSASMSKTWNSPGTYQVKAQAKDQHGELSGWSDTKQVTIEDAPPSTYSLTINVQPSEGGYVEVQFSGGGGGIVDVSQEFTDIPEGTTIELIACEDWENDWEFDKWTGDFTGSNDHVTITMDKDKVITANFKDTINPTVTITSPAEGHIYSTSSVTIKWSGQDNYTPKNNLEYRYRLIKDRSDPEWSAWAKADSKLYGSLTNGEYRFEVKVKDEFGNEGSATRNFVIKKTGNENAAFSFVHITDLHLCADNNLIWRWYETLEYMVNDLKPKFILVTGDIADSGAAPSGPFFYKTFKEPLYFFKNHLKWNDRHIKEAGLTDYTLSGGNGFFTIKKDGFDTGIKVFCAPGNHDASGGPDGFKHYEDYIGPKHCTYFKQTLNDVSGHKVDIFSINTGTTGWDFSFMPTGDGIYDSVANKLKKDLADSTGDRIRIILTHHPYIYKHNDDKDNAIFIRYNRHANNPVYDSDGKDFGNWCDDYDVDIVLSGHTHGGSYIYNSYGGRVRSEIYGNAEIIDPANNNPDTGNKETAFLTTPSIGYSPVADWFFDIDTRCMYRKIDVLPSGRLKIYFPEEIEIGPFPNPKAKTSLTLFQRFIHIHLRNFPLFRYLMDMPFFEKMLSLN